MLKHHSEVKCKYVINDDDKRKSLTAELGDHFIETKSLFGVINALKAGVWFTSAGLPVHILFSGKKRIIFNLWHGTPLKKIATRDKTSSWLKITLLKLFHSRNYTYISTSSSKLINMFSESFAVKSDIIKVLGQPRNDWLLNNSDSSEEWFGNHFSNLPENEKIILYAPTFREYGQTELFPFSDYTLDKLEEFLEDEKIIIFLRLHHAEMGNPQLKPRKRIKYINSDIIEEINPILSLFDLLITDYSGIYFDFLLTEKPILFLPYDLEEYENESRGFNFDYYDFSPGPKPNTLKEFINEVERLLSDKQYYQPERKQMNNYFNEIKEESSNLIYHFIKNEIS
jgi:CDP-glycerol glycerophosphotransferase